MEIWKKTQLPTDTHCSFFLLLFLHSIFDVKWFWCSEVKSLALKFLTSPALGALHLVVVVLRAGELILHGSASCPHGGLLGRRLDVGVLPGSRSPLLLSFGHARPSAAIEIMDLHVRWGYEWLKIQLLMKDSFCFLGFFFKENPSSLKN